MPEHGLHDRQLGAAFERLRAGICKDRGCLKKDPFRDTNQGRFPDKMVSTRRCLKSRLKRFVSKSPGMTAFETVHQLGFLSKDVEELRG
jgi:hypothetical protein